MARRGRTEEIHDVALVLRRFDFGETSQTARLFLREHGRVGVLAKGVKRPNDALRGPMDLFALADVALRWRPKSDLHLLTRYRVRTGFSGLRRNLDRLYGAFYVSELLREGTRDRDAQPALFDATVATLEALEHARSGAVPLICCWFELAWLQLAGFAPRWHACAFCARPAPKTGPVRFAPFRGGVLCRSCLAQRPVRTILLDTAARVAIDGLLAADGPASVAELDVPITARRVLRDLLPRHIQGLMEKELRAASFVAP